MVADAGLRSIACGEPQACRVLGVEGVCREGVCNPQVPCGSDYECSLGEQCREQRCRFTGCVRDADCATGKCLGETFTCVECRSSVDCPRDRPVCDEKRNTCQSCQRDAECAVPGPARCSPLGACVHCLVDADCPNGLSCGSNNVCFGAQKNQPCPPGTACGAGLSCVMVNGNPQCLPTCNLYQPSCEMGEICFRLTYQNSNSLVFETQGPIGVCFGQQSGLRGPRELCIRSPNGGSNCQPNLQCIPESATTALCRTYCNPLASGGCVGTEKCVAFVGDFNGRRYGLCLPDTGFGQSCGRDAQCRASLSCQPYDDPSSLNEVSNICQYSFGAGLGLAPCAARVTDAGVVVSADVVCRSGLCRGDPLTSSSHSYFCYASCEKDDDCSIGGRNGVCDGEFSVVTAFGTEGRVRGCRPSCTSEASCAPYDAGVACRLRLVQTPADPKLVRTCSPGLGSGRAGAVCLNDSDCRSGWCLLEDARGVRRAPGYCLEACDGASGCASAGFATDCANSTLLVSLGPDGVSNTPDDRLVETSLCVGQPCTTNETCVNDAGVRAICAPMVSASGTFGALRCQPVASGSKGAGVSCATDLECQSGVCGTLQSPSTGSGKACFEACAAGSVCPNGMMCRAQGMQIQTMRGPLDVDTCAP
jgi:hypothetical protein